MIQIFTFFYILSDNFITEQNDHHHKPQHPVHNFKSHTKIRPKVFHGINKNALNQTTFEVSG